MMGPYKGAKESRRGYVRASIALAPGYQPQISQVNALDWSDWSLRRALWRVRCGCYLLLGLVTMLMATNVIALARSEAELPWLSALLVTGVGGWALAKRRYHGYERA